MAKKAPTKTALKKKLWTLLSRNIKERDGHKCWVCGSGANLQCSHILPKGEYERYMFEEWNLKTLCYKHHLEWWHKNPIEAADWFRGCHIELYVFIKSKIREYKINPPQPLSLEDLSDLIQKYDRPITF